MKYFKDKVAVITGAASGIGRGLTERCLAEGMHVVMADIEEKALQETAQALRGQGANSVLAVPTDVAVKAEIEALAARTIAEFGEVHLLFNNAGIAAGPGILGTTDADWDWVMGVNLMSVIHGLRTFLPIMIAQESEAHVVNTASVAGLLYGGGSVSYSVTKHAVVALTESSYFELAQAGSKVGMSVLCPGFIATNIMDASRNRPARFRNEATDANSPQMFQRQEMVRQMIAAGMAPADLAAIVFDGIRAQRLYILTHEDFDQMILQRAQHITEGTNPDLPFQV
ncbi:MAG: SDR family NAD(P)-dependent oxidoreductase [Proteobacteria bacterium]|nr:SDR family NAD(P)-dependent oxidoreductase [Pseudomonadota bacterium]